MKPGLTYIFFPIKLSLIVKHDVLLTTLVVSVNSVEVMQNLSGLGISHENNRFIYGTKNYNNITVNVWALFIQYDKQKILIMY